MSKGWKYQPTTDPTQVNFRPRYDDCEPGGRLHPAGYLRAMLQAAIEAGAAKDLGAPENPDAADTAVAPADEAAAWLERVGDLGMKIEAPVMFGDAVEIDTRLATQGPDVWRRVFVFKRAGAVVANGFVDCFGNNEDEQTIEPETEQETISENAEESESAFSLTAEPSAAEPPVWDGPMPDPPKAPGRSFKGIWHVAWQHLDLSGQVDPAALTTMVGDMEARANESLGWTPACEYEAGFVWQVGEHRLELFDVIQDEDDLHILSYIGEVDEAVMVRHTSIWRDDSGVHNEVARTRTRWACFDPTSGERGIIPDEWLEDMADQFAEG